MTGRLLMRHGGSAMAPQPTGVDMGRSVDNSAYDPLLDSFVIPPSIPATPRGLAIFFMNRLRTCFDSQGKSWVSPLPLKAHLRLAKILLEEVGYNSAIRAIVYAVHIANHCPSFVFVLKCARERFSG